MTNLNHPAAAMLESEGFSPIHRCVTASLSSRLDEASLPLRDVLGLYVYLKMLAGDARNAWPSQRHLVEQLEVSRQTLSLWLGLLSKWGLVKSYLVINDRGIHAHYLVFDHISSCEWRVERKLPAPAQLSKPEFATRCYLCREGGKVRAIRVGGKVQSTHEEAGQGSASIPDNRGGKEGATMEGLSTTLADGVVNQPCGGVVKQAGKRVVKPVRQNIDTRDIDTINTNTLNNNNDDSLAPSSRGRRGRGEEADTVIPNNDNASSPIPRHEDAGLNPNSPLPPLSEEEQSRYQLAERRLRSHYDIPPSRSPSPPTVRLLLELAREFTEAETTHIFDVVDREKDRSAGVPPRQQYLRTTMANVKREREGGEEDERAAQGRPRPHGAAIRRGGGSGAAAAGREPAGLKELREQVRAMRASGGGFARSGRSTNW